MPGCCRIVPGQLSGKAASFKARRVCVRSGGTPCTARKRSPVGGATLAAEAAALDLINEYRAMVYSALVGGGIPYSP
jgi:hypothetical protein